MLSKHPDENEITNEEIYADSIADFIDYDNIDPTQEIKLILPEGAKVVYSADAGDTVKVNHYNENW